MIVIDASPVVDLLLDTPPFADRIAGHIRDADGDLHAPHLLEAEGGQAFRRYLLNGDLTPGRAEGALERLGDVGVQLYAHLPFLPRAVELRRNLTVHDRLYTSL